MTREEEIEKAVYGYSKQLENRMNGIDYFNQENVEYAFIDGIEWADANPKSTWISVDEDLPCNHKELLLSTGYHTVTVFTYKKSGACGMDNMIVRNGKWEWEAWKENYLYWMPIPKFPKE